MYIVCVIFDVESFLFFFWLFVTISFGQASRERKAKAYPFVILPMLAVASVI